MTKKKTQEAEINNLKGVTGMTVPAEGLRAWAQGDYPTEAGVELLIRAKGGRFARATCPWIEPLEPPSSLYSVNWDRLRDELGVFSGGEQRFLKIAVAMGSPDHPVDLSNSLTGLDDELLLLVLATTAHAAGRPQLLSPASRTAGPTGAAPTDPPQSSTRLGTTSSHASSPIASSMNPTDSHRARPVRRPENERRTDPASPEQHDGPRP